LENRQTLVFFCPVAIVAWLIMQRLVEWLLMAGLIALILWQADWIEKTLRALFGT
jgi:diacylglycerol kinase